MKEETKIERACEPRDPELLEKLTEVWEDSVRATHHFLCEDDIRNLRPCVIAMLREVSLLLVAGPGESPVGFMGIEGEKIEMLFLSPSHISRGLGRRMIELAVSSYGARLVDVNEQNERAAGFYEHMGFRVFRRDAEDAQGNPFPILHMVRTKDTHFRKIGSNKKQYLDLLLLGDEQESMIDRYLERGTLFALHAAGLPEPICVAVITDEGNGVCELKNIAVSPTFQRKGYGKQMVDYLCRHCRDSFHTMLVGTGESRKTLQFYKNCGFQYSHTLENFFTDNYDHAIYEDGTLLKDMVYFSKRLAPSNAPSILTE